MDGYEEGRRIVRANVASEMSKRGWNTADLARAAGIDLGTAGDFINGTRWPQIATQNKIEEVFEWSPGSIFRWERGLPHRWRDEDFPESVSPEPEDAGVLASLPPEALEGLDAMDRKEVIAAAKLSALQKAREIRRRDG